MLDLQCSVLSPHLGVAGLPHLVIGRDFSTFRRSTFPLPQESGDGGVPLERGSSLFTRVHNELTNYSQRLTDAVSAHELLRGSKVVIWWEPPRIFPSGAVGTNLYFTVNSIPALLLSDLSNSSTDAIELFSHGMVGKSFLFTPLDSQRLSIVQSTLFSKEALREGHLHCIESFTRQKLINDGWLSETLDQRCAVGPLVFPRIIPPLVPFNNFFTTHHSQRIAELESELADKELQEGTKVYIECQIQGSVPVSIMEGEAKEALRKSSHTEPTEISFVNASLRAHITPPHDGPEAAYVREWRGRYLVAVVLEPFGYISSCAYRSNIGKSRED